MQNKQVLYNIMCHRFTLSIVPVVCLSVSFLIYTITFFSAADATKADTNTTPEVMEVKARVLWSWPGPGVPSEAPWAGSCPPYNRECLLLQRTSGRGTCPSEETQKQTSGNKIHVFSLFVWISQRSIFHRRLMVFPIKRPRLNQDPTFRCLTGLCRQFHYVHFYNSLASF